MIKQRGEVGIWVWVLIVIFVVLIGIGSYALIVGHSSFLSLIHHQDNKNSSVANNSVQSNQHTGVTSVSKDRNSELQPPELPLA